MNQTNCANCDEVIEFDHLDELYENPDGQPICADCNSLDCQRCGHTVDFEMFEEKFNRHEDGGVVCDTCPTPSFPMKVDVEYRRETYDNRLMMEDVFGIDPDSGYAGTLWEIGTWTTVTFRLDSPTDYEMIAVNGKSVE